MKVLASVSPRKFLAASLFAAKEDVRFYLKGVHIERHPKCGVVLVATDGITMIAIHDPEGWIAAERNSLIIARPRGEMRSQLHKAAEKPFDGKHLALGENVAVLAEGLGFEPGTAFGAGWVKAWPSSLIDGKYPDWRRTLMEHKTHWWCRTPPINPALLVRFSQASAILNPNISEVDDMSAISLAPGDSESGIAMVRFWEHPLREEVIGAIMPMRGFEPLDATLPDWLYEPPRKPRVRSTAEGLAVVAN